MGFIQEKPPVPGRACKLCLHIFFGFTHPLTVPIGSPVGSPLACLDPLIEKGYIGSLRCAALVLRPLSRWSPQPNITEWAYLVRVLLYVWVIK